MRNATPFFRFGIILAKGGRYSMGTIVHPKSHVHVSVGRAPISHHHHC
jgi:hypothetical protein